LPTANGELEEVASIASPVDTVAVEPAAGDSFDAAGNATDQEAA